ncbi:hypothetical protein GCM10007978_09950 [Shewanella hanedai]|jgi:biotin carboxyl carrier protein|uniref:Biotin/lipoyl-binding protein n=1 Tax=Shewanella hanedai TaxID=25 RepID=A0A553JRT9_SHEHA|nr:acetyl-CoA carboxylase biotin carboxyl carrier protein subunit [Shewanella hanedai]TRY15167.1 biotin/lipoyl-binding protein [Shewanella hanedai]GGI74213.1 hypothetical protein GCM10007978_09950 [Shewanella hanedai]
MAEQVEVKIPGSVWKVLVEVGDKVEAGDVLFILEVMKTEVPHEAPIAGEITKIFIGEGSIVDAQDPAIEIS